MAAQGDTSFDIGHPAPHRGRVPVALLVLGLIAFLLLRGDDSDEESDAEVPVVDAAIGTARIEDFPVTVAALGTVVPGPGAEARPAAPAPTRVTRVLVAQGDAVRAGQPLVTLDASVFQARLDQAETALTSAREAYSRMERLVEQGISPRKELESAAAELAQARAARAEARRNREMSIVRSPIEGVVTAVEVALGQPVEANQPLVDIVDPAGLSILFRLSPGDAARVNPGAEVSLSSPGSEVSAEDGGALGHGSVAGVSAAVDSATGSVAIRVVATTPARRLLAGESVGGRITVGVHSNAVVVPLSALVPGEEGLHVFVVDEGGIAHETRVVVGERSDSAAEILSGLEGGERVVTEGAYGVSDGARIHDAKA